MRINTLKAGSNSNPLLLLWAELFSAEFQVNQKVSLKYVKHAPEQVAEFLKLGGWSVEWYVLPSLPKGVEWDAEEPPIHSQGYIVAEDCEKYVEWRLRET